MADTIVSAEPEFRIRRLLETDSLLIRDVQCAGTCRHLSAEECASTTHLVFPYRGVYVRHVGTEQAVADANHVLFFNADEGYRISHPVAGGDRSLGLVLDQALLRELAPASALSAAPVARFRVQQRRIDGRAQAMVARLGHGLAQGYLEPLAAESLALTLVARSLCSSTSHGSVATRGRRRLVDRIKLLLASDVSRRWTLAEVAAKVGGSPVYLTQAFRQVEGLPLYRYHLRLRLARALDLLPAGKDLAALAAELGFSSHSHFSAAFRQAYGHSPSQFLRAAAR